TSGPGRATGQPRGRLPGVGDWQDLECTPIVEDLQRVRSGPIEASPRAATGRDRDPHGAGAGEQPNRRVSTMSSRPTRQARGKWSRPVRPLAALLVLTACVAAGVVVHQLRAVERDARAARAGVAAGKPAAARPALVRWLRARPSSAEAHALLAE